MGRVFFSSPIYSTMFTLAIILTSLVLSTSSLSVEKTKAASSLINCGCQCSSLTFRDSAGTEQGNCKTVDGTGAQWCYVDSTLSTCQDLVPSERFPHNPWSYQACATPALGSYLCPAHHHHHAQEVSVIPVGPPVVQGGLPQGPPVLLSGHSRGPPVSQGGLSQGPPVSSGGGSQGPPIFQGGLPQGPPVAEGAQGPPVLQGGLPLGPVEASPNPETESDFDFADVADERGFFGRLVGPSK